ncbi:MAG: type II toxin-antitoxin system PemK/MazF family toxin, partial [Actinomycetaceae bacterium]|nr:type II toxin-antitoxin system PemK/MazF family toxin [Actinomycetaceae bacterium]
MSSSAFSRLASAALRGAMNYLSRQLDPKRSSRPRASTRRPHSRRRETSHATSDRASATSSGDSHGAHYVPAGFPLPHFEYAPERNGAADPGEVVWAWVPYEEDHSRGKDRPVLVLADIAEGVLCAQMTSKDHDCDAEQEARWGRYWMDIGTGEWDSQRRPSEVRLDRLVLIPHDEVRREGGRLDERLYQAVTARIREVQG